MIWFRLRSRLVILITWDDVVNVDRSIVDNRFPERSLNLRKNQKLFKKNQKNFKKKNQNFFFKKSTSNFFSCFFSLYFDGLIGKNELRIIKRHFKIFPAFFSSRIRKMKKMSAKKRTYKFKRDFVNSQQPSSISSTLLLVKLSTSMASRPYVQPFLTAAIMLFCRDSRFNTGRPQKDPSLSMWMLFPSKFNAVKLPSPWKARPSTSTISLALKSLGKRARKRTD